MRTYPRSGSRYGGTSECTLVLVFVPGEHPPKPPFWKPPFWGTPDICVCVCVCAPLYAAKSCAEHPVVVPVAGELGAAEKPEFARRGHEANAGPGAQSEAPEQGSGAGHPRRPGPENQDSQHK